MYTRPLGELKTLLDDLQGFVRKAIELQDKYMGYVKNCFMDHALFAKVCISSLLLTFLAQEDFVSYFFLSLY